MSAPHETATTSIARHAPDDVFIRDKSLCRELIGKLGFTDMLVFQILGRIPTAAERTVIEGCLVALMEHGLTPSVISARLTYSSAPEALQAAVAAGLLGVGGVFAGSMEGAGELIDRLLKAEGSLEAEAQRIAEEHRAQKKPLPGFGHPTHKPDDPRALRLLKLARDEGVAGSHVEAIETLSRAIDQVYGRHITINATGAIAACLGDCGVPSPIMRGFALIARAAGLVGHLLEEQQKPAMRAIWEAAERAVPYDSRRKE
jgi:citrate synthase